MRFEIVRVGRMSNGRITLYVVVDTVAHKAVTKRDGLTISEQVRDSLNGRWHNCYSYTEPDEVADAILAVL